MLGKKWKSFSLGHSYIRQVLGAKGENIVGVRMMRGPGNTIYTNEHSGHYGGQWTPEILKQFE
ncbi:polymorphic toxin type 43 domain-containing protein [Nonomuraea basaltis]|uniref:polymorphic toxin type 43 domain-containing protein n=1 Tax=Nonomuraea basaltis TaxID=2495887 RepID=UPI001486D522